MKKPALVFVPIVGAVFAVAITAARFGPTIQPNCILGPLDVGGLTKEQATARLQAWWQIERSEPLTLDLRARKLKVRIYETGIAPDFSQSISQLPMTEILDSARSAVAGAPAAQRFDIKFDMASSPASRITTFASEPGAGRPARVYLTDGKFTFVPGQPGVGLDKAQFANELPQAIQSGATDLEVPTAKLDPRGSIQDLEKINSVVSSFTTRFPVRKKDRNNNIRLAASKIDGYVLMPGDRFSFNTVVGKRTIEDGFKEAPVFLNGGHGMGVGGGICQVSSTLYNAALLADLKIVQRHNHSMPVAYVPLGRDATVDYGTLDLVLRNSLSAPIALSARYEAGKLTFRVLGQDDPSLKVQITSSDRKEWDVATKTVDDAKLPLGKERIVEKGSKPRSIVTYRLVYRNGALVEKEMLGKSYYRGGERVVAVGTKAIPPAPISITTPVPVLPGGG